MRQAVMCLGVTFALVIGVAASAHAQQGQGNANAQEKKQKRQPNQVPDNGSGQSDLAADTTFERVVTSVPVTVRADGTIVVELNDSFMEAQTATIAPDGSLRYDHITGLQRTAEFVRAQAPSASTQLPSRAVRVAFPSEIAFRFYEVK